MVLFKWCYKIHIFNDYECCGTYMATGCSILITCCLVKSNTELLYILYRFQTLEYNPSKSSFINESSLKYGDAQPQTIVHLHEFKDMFRENVFWFIFISTFYILILFKALTVFNSYHLEKKKMNFKNQTATDL